VQPILHLSVPVHDLAAAREFYVDTLGCQPGRVRAEFVDVWFYGMQVTLHDRPEEVALPPEGARHFGVTLARPEFDQLVDRLRTRAVKWLVPVSTDHEGQPTEQTKTKIADPSGNVIELKTYPDVAAALELPRRASPETVEPAP
jgi:extradiol dioxygenase family protein